MCSSSYNLLCPILQKALQVIFPMCPTPLFLFDVHVFQLDIVRYPIELDFLRDWYLTSLCNMNKSDHQ